MIAGALRMVADWMDPPRRDPRADMPVPAARSLFEDRLMQEQRQEDALALMDDECRGYILLQLRDEHSYLRISPSFAVPDEAWPAMQEALARCARAAGQVYR